MPPETNRWQVLAAATHASEMRDAAAIHAQTARVGVNQNAVSSGTGEAGFASVLGRNLGVPQVTSQPQDGAEPPANDRYGNANYDQDGNPVGARGIGLLVDNPDVPAQLSQNSGDVSDKLRQDAAQIDMSINAEVDAGTNP